jgi:hypothetical protein
MSSERLIIKASKEKKGTNYNDEAESVLLLYNINAWGVYVYLNKPA